MREGPGAGRSVGGADLSLLLFLGVLWGTAFVFITVGLESFSPILLVALRFDITALVMFGIAAIRRKGSLLPRGRVQWTAIAIAAVFNITGYHALLFWAQQHTAAGLAAMIVALNPGGLNLAGISELMIAGAIVSWSLGSVLVKRTRHGMDTFVFIAWQSLAGAGILHVLSL